MLLEILPKMSASGFMGYLKDKNRLLLYERFGDLKFKYRNREFGCRGYYVDMVGKNKEKIKDYKKKQLEEDELGYAVFPSLLVQQATEVPVPEAMRLLSGHLW